MEYKYGSHVNGNLARGFRAASMHTGGAARYIIIYARKMETRNKADIIARQHNILYIYE